MICIKMFEVDYTNICLRLIENYSMMIRRILPPPRKDKSSLQCNMVADPAPNTRFSTELCIRSNKLHFLISIAPKLLRDSDPRTISLYLQVQANSHVPHCNTFPLLTQDKPNHHTTVSPSVFSIPCDKFPVETAVENEVPKLLCLCLLNRPHRHMVTAVLRTPA